uniref:NADH-ubiquinone oxidoreductase chain 2 n=1 Tax=Rhizophydium sp. 136 TaxID=60187 RepID=Q950L9_9FUNG|nr:NADH dehydrogenase subunit 2 [Rhizophydium sp. 136]AAK84289.1 NADH dehydrogenase subunit 2 [Rhizophydium sp. 136]
MNLILQFLGLIFNLYFVFIFTEANLTSKLAKKTKAESTQLEDSSHLNFSTIINKTHNHNKIKFLNKIAILLLILYIFFDLQLLLNSKEIVGSNQLTIMDGIYKINEVRLGLEIFLLVLAIMIINAQTNYYYNKSNTMFSEKNLILLTNILGITSLIFSNDWLITIISWELLNISLYLLVSLNSYSESSLSSSLKYVLLSALSTGFLLLGVSIIYLLIGNLNYENITISLTQILLLNDQSNELFSMPNLINLAFILILSTILFKLSAAPFYNWSPDLYDGLNSNITMWMMIIPKISICIFLYIITSENFLLISTSSSILLSSIDFLLLLSGILSLIIGSCALYAQWNIKRFLAYSSISHLGFMLLALYSYDFHSYFIYIFIYGSNMIAIFSILLILSKYFGREIKSINQLIGIYRLNPFISIALAINFLSLAGVCLFIFYNILRFYLI